MNHQQHQQRMGVLDDDGWGESDGGGGGCHGGSGMDDDDHGVMVDHGVTGDSVIVIAVVVTEGLHVVE